MNQLKINETEFDAVIIGGGPAGYNAAIHIAELVGKACLIEKETLGGVCAKLGCIPTKTLLAKAALFETVQEEAKKGIFLTIPLVDTFSLWKSAEEAAQKVQQGVSFLLSKQGVSLLLGKAVIKSISEVIVHFKNNESEIIKTKNIIIATGSRPRLLPGTCLSYQVITSDQISQIFKRKVFPRSIVIVGAGYIGLEYASLFNTLGVNITIIENLPSLLPQEDQEVRSFLIKSLTKKNIKLLCNREVLLVEEKESKVKINVKNLQSGCSENIETEILLVAIGREANFEAEELQKIGLSFSRQGIFTDKHMRTNLSSIYAIGDVAGKYQLAHIATWEGLIAAKNIMGQRGVMDYSKVPKCIFTYPEIASVGVQTKLQGKAFFLANGKAIASGNINGFVKVYLEENRIVGASIIGNHASELIGVAIPLLGKDALEVKEFIFPHPTLSEAILEAVHNALEQRTKIHSQ